MQSPRFTLSLYVLGMVFFGCSCTQLWPTPREPHLGVEASGERLWIRTQENEAQVTERKKVGEAVHKDADGNSVGSTDVYANETRTVRWTTWYPMQGDLQLDDEDFLRIVGDQEGLARTREFREQGLAMNKWGKRSLVGGAVALVASFFIPSDMYLLRYGTSLGGAIFMSGGWYLARAGAARFDPEAHAVEPVKASHLVHDYNASLDGRAPGAPKASLSVGGEF